MNKNSLMAYFDKSNQRKFNSHKAMIVRELKLRPNQHSREIAIRLKLSNEAVKKRLTDLKKEGSIEVAFDTVFMSQTVGVYRIKEQLSMFHKEQKPSLKKWLEINYPATLYEYEALINHKI